MPITHRLKLYRRHISECSEGYAKDFRIVESDSLKATGKRQCSCTIVVQGTLPTGKFLKHPSTGEIAWTEAHKVAALWWEWGDTTPPADVVWEIQQEQNAKATTVSDAVEEFIAVKKNENVSPDIITHHRQVLTDRLVPFAKRNGIAFIQQMDNPKCWSEFRQSWINLNPLHNRKLESGVMPKAKLVEPATAKRMLGQTRQFIRFCIGRGWITQEWAARKFLKVITRVEPKEPFADEDVQAIFAATNHITYQGKIGHQNGKEVLAFCYVLRYSGLRISDATKLEDANLVPRPGDHENSSLHVFMKKTKKWVFIPIPSGDIPGEPNVAAVLRSLPLKQGKYFFLTGDPSKRSGTNSWWERLTHLFGLVEKHGHELSVHPHPHRFRHTFAARLLEGGMDVRDVAEFLGDTVAVVLKHYAKFTTKQQELAVEKWKRVMAGGPIKRTPHFEVSQGRKRKAGR